MVLPLASVTLIGLIATVLAVGLARRQLPAALVRGLLGSWAGFIGGALLGVTIDVAASTGVWVGVLGHVAAVAGAVVAETRTWRQAQRSRGMPQ
jgi:hypothetical protein